MTTTSRLALPLMAAGQAQKHVTYNEALIRLDQLVQLSVISDSLDAPPTASIADDAAYLVPETATGAWAAHKGKLAFWDVAGFSYVPPKEGWQLWVSDRQTHRIFTNGFWQDAASDQLAQLGINSTADSYNRLTVASDGVLFTAEQDSHRIAINKIANSDTASIVMQSAYSGHAELGLTGDNDLHVKVSASGTNWQEALVIDSTTGAVHMPLTIPGYSENLLINGHFSVNQRQFSGGALTAGTYGFDRWKAGNAGASVSVSNGALTLSSGAIEQIVEATFHGLQDFANATLSFSVENLSGNSLSVKIGDQTLIISPGSGRKGGSVVLPSAGSLVTVKLSPVAGTVSFARAKLEIGPRLTAWRPRPLAAELARCQYYYFDMTAELVGGSLVYDAYADSASALSPMIIPFPAQMRIAPSVSWSGSYNTSNILPSDAPLLFLPHRTCAVLRPRGVDAGRRLVTCSSGARLHFSAEL